MFSLHYTSMCAPLSAIKRPQACTRFCFMYLTSVNNKYSVRCNASPLWSLSHTHVLTEVHTYSCTTAISVHVNYTHACLRLLPKNYMLACVHACVHTLTTTTKRLILMSRSPMLPVALSHAPSNQLVQPSTLCRALFICAVRLIICAVLARHEAQRCGVFWGWMVMVLIIYCLAPSCSVCASMRARLCVCVFVFKSCTTGQTVLKA